MAKLKMLLALSLSLFLWGRANTTTAAIIIDSNLSPSYTTRKIFAPKLGITLAINIAEGYKHLEQKINISSPVIDNTTKVLLRSMVLAEVCILNYDLFGRGWRILGEGGKISQISLGCFSSKSIAVWPHEVQPHSLVFVNIGGLEANYLLAENLKNKMIYKDAIEPMFGHLYSFSQLNQAFFSISQLVSPKSVNFFNEYLINCAKAMKHLLAKNTKQEMSVTKLQWYSFLDFLDPMLYPAAYAALFNRTAKIPMINLTDKIQYLPALKSLLTPYGPEVRFANYFKTSNTDSQLIIRLGKNYGIQSLGLDLNIDNIYRIAKHGTVLGGSINGWRQPDFLKGSDKNLIGGLAKINIHHKFKKKKWSANLSVGYKTTGYQLNAPIHAGWLFSINASRSL